MCAEVQSSMCDTALHAPAFTSIKLEWFAEAGSTSAADPGPCGSWLAAERVRVFNLLGDVNSAKTRCPEKLKTDATF